MEPSVTHSTFVIEHSYPYPPERLFDAFADPEKKRRWHADRGSPTVGEFTMDFRVGGIERLRFPMGPDTPFPGVLLTNDTVYQDIVPNQRIVYAYTMTIGDHRMSSSLITFEFLPLAQGTELRCTHQGAFFEGSDGPQMREAGWRSLIARLSEELKRTDSKNPEVRGAA
jgi:uncharacterized protein YndB with AHSA1/START domain